MLDESPAELGRRRDELLEPTAIYVPATLQLLRSEVEVRGLAHYRRMSTLNAACGYEIDRPLPAQPVFSLIARLGDVPKAETTAVSTWAPASCA